MRHGYQRIITSSRKVLIGIAALTAGCTAMFSLPVHALHEEPSADLSRFFLLFYCVTGVSWLMVTEHACFTGLAVKGDYLVLAKSLPIPVRRYIRLDQVKQLRSSLLYREMYDDGVHTGPVWGAKTEKRVVDTTQQLTYWRILVAVLASLPFQPWRFIV